MKNRQGFQLAGVIAGIVLAALIIIAAYFVIDGNNKATDFNNYDFYSIIEADNSNGNIGDHVKGNPDAPVIIYEYADYQCPGCASINPKVNKAVNESDGKLAIVYRNFLLSYHKNGTAAASAAEAAGLQGYWKPYADKLFAEQSEWEYASASERTEFFEKYFLDVTESKGDLEQFRKDVSSDRVSKKISFDMGIARRIDVPSTPAFYIDGQHINWTEAGQIEVNGEIISWEENDKRTNDDFVSLLERIVEAKTK